ERDPLHRMSYKSDKIYIPRDLNQRRVQKAFLRYHDAKNWPLLREELKAMGRTDLIGSGPNALVPAEETAMLKNSKRPGFKPGGNQGSDAVAARKPQPQGAQRPKRGMCDRMTGIGAGYPCSLFDMQAGIRQRRRRLSY